MRPSQVRKAPDPAVATSRHPDAATSRRRGLGPAPDPVGAVERESPHLANEAQQVEALAIQILKDEGFDPYAVSTHHTAAGLSRYVYAERVIREHITVRISDHRTTHPAKRSYSVVWKRPGRIWGLRKWIQQNTSRLRASLKHVELPPMPGRVRQHAGSASANRHTQSLEPLPPLGITGGKQGKAPQ